MWDGPIPSTPHTPQEPSADRRNTHPAIPPRTEAHPTPQSRDGTRCGTPAPRTRAARADVCLLLDGERRVVQQARHRALRHPGPFRDFLERGHDILPANFSKGFYYGITREGDVSGIGGVEVYP